MFRSVCRCVVEFVCDVMVCYAPLTAYRSRDVGPTGKRGITFSRNASFSGEALKLPCGQCIGCRLERSRQWAMRLMHEKQFHDVSLFLTLTYRDADLPVGRTLVKRDLQLFMKRVRKKFGKCRYFAAGEYGETTKRPHYHMILFGIDFSDKRQYTRFSGQPLYTSKILDDLWGHGECKIGDVSFESCAYVARYICDKITGDAARDWYVSVDSDGEVHEVCPEFVVMSRRPGIGMSWFEKFGKHAYELGSVVVNNKEVRPPRFYDVKMDAIDPERVRELSLIRRREAMKRKDDNTPERRRVRERVALLQLKSMKERDVQ